MYQCRNAANIYIYIYITVLLTHRLTHTLTIYIYIYIYILGERERKRERNGSKALITEMVRKGIGITQAKSFEHLCDSDSLFIAGPHKFILCSINLIILICILQLIEYIISFLYV